MPARDPASSCISPKNFFSYLQVGHGEGQTPYVMEKKQWLTMRLSMANARYIFKIKVEEGGGLGGGVKKDTRQRSHVHRKSFKSGSAAIIGSWKM